MSGRDLFFLLSPIVGLHFICMNFSCLNVARLNNEHLQCRPLSLFSYLCALESPLSKPASPAHTLTPQVFLRLSLNISWQPLLPSFVRERSLSEHERLKKSERTTFEGNGGRGAPEDLIQLKSNSGIRRGRYVNANYFCSI